jgi:hypothetical protein
LAKKKVPVPIPGLKTVKGIMACNRAKITSARGISARNTRAPKQASEHDGHSYFNSSYSNKLQELGMRMNHANQKIDTILGKDGRHPSGQNRMLSEPELKSKAGLK